MYTRVRQSTGQDMLLPVIPGWTLALWGKGEGAKGFSPRSSKALHNLLPPSLLPVLPLGIELRASHVVGKQLYH